jgi:hypothetical protein
MLAGDRRQWAAVSTIRADSKTPVQNPEPSGPRVSTMTVRSANGAASTVGPTIARAGAAMAAAAQSAATANLDIFVMAAGRLSVVG